jgi:hypothetical protein
VATGSGDFELTMDELRIVARYAVESAQQVLPLFEQADGHASGRGLPLRPRGSS